MPVLSWFVHKQVHSEKKLKFKKETNWCGTLNNGFKLEVGPSSPYL